MALLSLNMMAMSSAKIREHARFLSDRMAYELDLSPMQYDDVYEINYDFIYSVNNLMDDVVDGYIDAIDKYYDFLDYRNDDLRYVLSNRQYAKFIEYEYFYRPIYVQRNSWSFRVYNVYNNHAFYYFDRPSGYYSYIGSHARRYYANGYYGNRYASNVRYSYHVRIRDSKDFNIHRRNDFGANLRDRSQLQRDNNYRNANQQNRASDKRYRDNGKNVNSPSINKRNQGQSNVPGVVRSGRG